MSTRTLPETPRKRLHWALAFATVGLYGVVRAGTLLIDHYRRTAS